MATSDTLGHLQAFLERIMTNNLSLDKTGFVPGEGDYDDLFFCPQIEDDMPWDTTEVDW